MNCWNDDFRGSFVRKNFSILGAEKKPELSKKPTTANENKILDD